MLNANMIYKTIFDLTTVIHQIQSMQIGVMTRHIWRIFIDHRVLSLSFSFSNSSSVIRSFVFASNVLCISSKHREINPPHC